MMDVNVEQLGEWLEGQGFRRTFNGMGRPTSCGWYAYRPTVFEARECEQNTGKGKQVVVTPSRYDSPDVSFEGVEIDVTGSYHGSWFKVSAYNLKPREVVEQLPVIERQLIAAWNALETK